MSLRRVCGRPAIGRVQSQAHIAKATEKNWKTKRAQSGFSHYTFITLKSGADLVMLCNTHWSPLSGQVGLALAQVRCAIVFAVLKMNCQGAQTKPEHAESFVVSLSFWFPRLRFPSHAGVPPGVSRLKPGLKELWRAGEMCKGCGDAVAHM